LIGSFAEVVTLRRWCAGLKKPTPRRKIDPSEKHTQPIWAVLFLILPKQSKYPRRTYPNLFTQQRSACSTSDLWLAMFSGVCVVA
jgi:hypothetical protein